MKGVKERNFGPESSRSYSQNDKWPRTNVHQCSENSVRCSTDPEIRKSLQGQYFNNLQRRCILSFHIEKHLLRGEHSNAHTDITEWHAYINWWLFLPVSCLFYPPTSFPWIRRQGHQVRLRVFCLQSRPVRLFRDEAVAYKSATPGSGPEERRWFIIQRRDEGVWLMHLCIAPYEMKRI